LWVYSTPFGGLLAVTTPGSTYAFTFDWIVTNDIAVTGNPYADHIRIDCPDRETGAGDVWAVVYKPDMASVKISKKPAGLFPVEATVSGVLTGNNCSPVVAYAPDAAY